MPRLADLAALLYATEEEECLTRDAFSYIVFPSSKRERWEQPGSQPLKLCRAGANSMLSGRAAAGGVTVVRSCSCCLQP